MKTSSTVLIFLLALLVGCNTEVSGDSMDGGTDSQDFESDTGEQCECTWPSENYCVGDCIMMDCDGCNFEDVDCCAFSGDGEIWECAISYTGTPDCAAIMIYDPMCLGAFDSYCADETLLMECQEQEDIWENYYQEINCSKPEECDCGSGCISDGISGPHCWCCQSDGGVDGGGS